MKKIPLLVLSVLLTCCILAPCKPAASQNAPILFSLQQAQDYAYKNNYDLRNSANDIEIARKEVKKNTAIGLPQISGTVTYADNFQLPTTLIPNFFDTTNSGGFLEVKFGTRYNAGVSGVLTQLVYSGEYLVGLQTANAYLETVRQKMIKDQMDVRDLVTQAYIGVLIIDENARILDSTYQTIAHMVDEAKEVYKQGLIEDIDVDQLELNRSNLEAGLMNIRDQRLVAYSTLKFVMGIKTGQEITLTDNLDFFINAINIEYLMNQSFDIKHNIDYTLLEKQAYLTGMRLKLAKTAYQPSLAAYLQGGTNAYRESWDFLNTKSLWFANAGWGLQLNIPIWSSGQRKYSVDQARLSVEKMKVQEEQTSSALNLQVVTAKSDFNNSYNVFLNSRQAMEISKKIYDKTIEKYRQGVSSSTDLNQKYNQYLTNEQGYFQAMYNLLKSRIKLNKLLEKV